MTPDTDTSSEFITGNYLRFSDTFCDIREFQNSSGGYALLYSAHKEGRMFILKGLKPAYQNNPVYITLLRKEYEIAYPLDHPSLYKAIAFENIEKTGPCIVLEFIDGLSLRDMLLQNRITTNIAVKLIRELIDVTTYLHRHQVIHRDIKPENIIVTHQGNHLKLIDFGLANNDSYKPGPGGVGSKHYAAPELLEKGRSSPQSDIYSIGIIIKELAHNAKLPKTYNRVARKATAPSAEKRHISTEHLKKKLERKPYFSIVFTICLAFLILVSSGYFISISPKQQPESKNIQDIYYNCYLKIDSLLKNAEITPGIDISRPFYDFQKDSVTLIRKFSETIENEYGTYRTSLEYKKSLRWARQCLQKWLDDSRRQYASSLKAAVIKHFDSKANPLPWTVIRQQYIDRFGSIARQNTEFIERHTLSLIYG
ncbi:serine/threonine protein kinase [Culturomica massiliensis]|uniref:serine/threonine protein kinase n=1 Tax=Culturomica massiliensis TaxID=1841857 RepID=UPI00083905CA|nr:serine/threonine-protein kinase [Culturomica massiliensis]